MAEDLDRFRARSQSIFSVANTDMGNEEDDNRGSELFKDQS